jgi:hypothetical protein
MTGKFQPTGGIYEPSSDSPPDWSDVKTGLGYKMLCKIVKPSFCRVLFFTNFIIIRHEMIIIGNKK